MTKIVEARYKVRDMQRFMDEFQRAADMLKRYGFKNTWLHRDADNPKTVIVVHEADDLDRAREFYNSEEYQQCRKDAGVGKPDLTFMEQLAAMHASAAV